MRRGTTTANVTVCLLRIAVLYLCLLCVVSIFFVTYPNCAHHFRFISLHIVHWFPLASYVCDCANKYLQYQLLQFVCAAERSVPPLWTLFVETIRGGPNPMRRGPYYDASFDIRLDARMPCTIRGFMLSRECWI